MPGHRGADCAGGVGVKAIPTKWGGINFRSRLEARWAAFFTSVGWSWSYEPLDLDGYIPDFILHMHSEILVEVKPLTSLSELRESAAISKIRKSGWGNRLAVVVGASLLEWDSQTVIGSIFGGPDEVVEEEDVGEDYAVIGRCPTCKEVNFVAWWGIWRCQVCGASDGSMTQPGFFTQAERDAIEMLWRKCGNEVQWNAK